MSVPEAGQSAGRDERDRDEYEQQQARVLMALMQGFCAARYRKADNIPCPIDQGLYLGSVGAAVNKEALKSLNITHVLIVAKSLNPTFAAEFYIQEDRGRSRSVTVVLAYLMKKHQMSLQSAMSLVRSKRPQIAPNEGFMSQLDNFEKSLQVEQGRRLLQSN